MRWFRRREEDLDRELRDHLDLEKEELGDDAAAQRALGNLARIKEDVREVWGWASLDRVAQDLRYIFRQMKRTPGFTAIAIATLALGLGATTAMFSIVNSVLLQPLKYREPENLYVARTIPPPTANIAGDFANNSLQFEIWRDHCRGCESMALFHFLEVTLVGEGEPMRLSGLSISHRFFATLGVHPSLGRDFAPGEFGGNVILADSLWRSRFAADPSVIGRRIRLAGESHVIVGVLPPDLHLPKTGEWGTFSGPAETPVIFRPLEPYLNTRVPAGLLNYGAVIRLKRGVTREQGIAELNALLADVYRQYELETRVTLIPLQWQFTGHVRGALWLLLATVGVVLLIGCVNVGNLMLVRSAGRYREAGVRLALGASRARLFAVVLAEAMVLVSIGAMVGIALAFRCVARCRADRSAGASTNGRGFHRLASPRLRCRIPRCLGNSLRTRTRLAPLAHTSARITQVRGCHRSRKKTSAARSDGRRGRAEHGSVDRRRSAAGQFFSSDARRYGSGCRTRGHAGYFFSQSQIRSRLP